METEDTVSASVLSPTIFLLISINPSIVEQMFRGSEKERIWTCLGVVFPQLPHFLVWIPGLKSQPSQEWHTQSEERPLVKKLPGHLGIKDQGCSPGHSWRASWAPLWNHIWVSFQWASSSSNKCLSSDITKHLPCDVQNSSEQQDTGMARAPVEVLQQAFEEPCCAMYCTFCSWIVCGEGVGTVFRWAAGVAEGELRVYRSQLFAYSYGIVSV